MGQFAETLRGPVEAALPRLAVWGIVDIVVVAIIRPKNQH